MDLTSKMLRRVDGKGENDVADLAMVDDGVVDERAEDKADEAVAGKLDDAGATKAN